MRRRPRFFLSCDLRIVCVRLFPTLTLRSRRCHLSRRECISGNVGSLALVLCSYILLLERVGCLENRSALTHQQIRQYDRNLWCNFYTHNSELSRKTI